MKEKLEPQINEKPISVLLKVRSDAGQTIAEHRNKIERHGKAFLGKMGKSLGAPLCDKLNEQISSGRRTFLYLTIREGWNGEYVTFQCQLASVRKNISEAEKAFVPSYYAHLFAEVTTWFEIFTIGRIPREEMNRIIVLSSGREIMSVINTSATVFTVVTK